MSLRIHAFTILFLPLAGCSTFEGAFSETAPKQAQAVDSDSSASRSCALVASQRADDAVMALYVGEGSAEQQEIYQATYRSCLSWRGR